MLVGFQLIFLSHASLKPSVARVGSKCIYSNWPVLGFILKHNSSMEFCVATWRLCCSICGCHKLYNRWMWGMCTWLLSMHNSQEYTNCTAIMWFFFFFWPTCFGLRLNRRSLFLVCIVHYLIVLFILPCWLTTYHFTRNRYWSIQHVNCGWACVFKHNTCEKVYFIYKV